jgi:hypothetical protein
MIFTVWTEADIDVRLVTIQVPVKYDEEDMPNDFPFRKGDIWEILVDFETGVIQNWPKGVSHDLYMKVTDGGTYILHSAGGTTLAKLEQEYVPHGVVPGDYGDYIELKIDENGKITNWPKKPNVSAFFQGPED